MNAAAYFAARPGPWLIMPCALERLATALDSGAGRLAHAQDKTSERGPEPSDPPIPRDLFDRPWPGYRIGKDGIAHIQIQGPLFGSTALIDRLIALISGGMHTPDLVAALDDARTNRAVKGVLLEVDSPGGEATGIEDAADQIRALDARKPVVAHVSGFGASAAYWLSAGAGWIVSSPSAYTGSIGAVASFLDDAKALEQRGLKRYTYVSVQSPYKRPDPETEDGKASYQEFVDSLAARFLEKVAALRGTSALRVMEDFGQGDILIGPEAVKVGLVDQLGSRVDALRILAKRIASPHGRGKQARPENRTGRAARVMRVAGQPVLSTKGRA